MIEFFLNFLPEKSSFLNLFSYLSTRTILATLSGLVIVIFFGDYFINKIRSLQFKQSIGERGPESHKVKDGTPTMGGLLVIGAVIFSGLLWGDLSSKYILISLFCLLSFGLIGFIDDYIKVFKKNKEGLKGKFKVVGQIGVGLIVGSVLYFSDDVVVHKRVASDYSLKDGEKNVTIMMTLTAPGCGMGPVIADEVERKVGAINNVQSVKVELVWEPAWNQTMMTDAARLELGML